MVLLGLRGERRAMVNTIDHVGARWVEQRQIQCCANTFALFAWGSEIGRSTLFCGIHFGTTAAVVAVTW